MNSEATDPLADSRTRRSEWTVRAGFWLSCLSLTLAASVYTAFPTLRMTAAQLMPWLLLGTIASIAAVIFCAKGGGSVAMRVGGALIGIAAVALWSMEFWFAAIMQAGGVR